MNNVCTTRVITKLGRRVARSIAQSKSLFIKYCPEGTSFFPSLVLQQTEKQCFKEYRIALHFATVSKRGASLVTWQSWIGMQCTLTHRPHFDPFMHFWGVWGIQLCFKPILEWDFVIRFSPSYWPLRLSTLPGGHGMVQTGKTCCFRHHG